MPKKPTQHPRELKPVLFLEVLGGDLRVTLDGSRPTLKRGDLMPQGTCYTWTPKAFAFARFLPASPKANLYVTLFRL